MGYNKWDIEQMLARRSDVIRDNMFFDALEKELPPILSRKQVCEKTGGLFSVKTLANFDYMHKGPGKKLRLGRKVGYERRSFIEWLRNNLNFE
jgi:hypothetical protein